jgi:hypothetical protein
MQSLSDELAAAASQADALRESLSAREAQLADARAQTALLATKLAETSLQRAAATSQAERLQFELAQACSAVEDSSQVLVRVEQAKQALQLQLEQALELQERHLVSLRSHVDGHAAAEAAHAAHAAAASEQLAALRSEAVLSAQARATADERAAAAERALAETLADLSQARAEVQKVESQLLSLVAAAVLTRRQAVLASLGAALHCKTGLLWSKPRSGSVGMSDWHRCAASLSRAGVLELHAGPSLSGDVRCRVDVAQCASVTTSRVDNYRTLMLSARGPRTTAFSISARSSAAGSAAAATLLVASGSTDADTHAWCELIHLFLPLPACGSAAGAAFEEDAFTPLAARRIEL